MRYVITLMAVVLIVLIIAGPSLLGAFSDVGDSIARWVKYGFEDEVDDAVNGDEDDLIPNGDEDDEEEEDVDENGIESNTEEMGLGIIVQFIDGTQKTVSPEDMTFTLFPMTVYFEGKEVASIWWSCYLLVDWTGDLSYLKLQGPLEVTVPEEGDLCLRKEGMLRNYGPEDLTAGEWKEVWKFGLEAWDIEYSLGSGDFTLKADVSVNVEVMFESGVKETKEGQATSSLSISIEGSQLTVFSVDIQTTILNP